MSSRESDSAYPPPRNGGTPGRRQGEGSDAYPSGTPPYGTGIPGANPFATGGPGDPPPASGRGYPHLPDGKPAATGAEGPDDDVPKTETTLTTRVRINIPGSRPIPPVVVRSPVTAEEAPAEPAGPRHRADTSASPVLGVVDAGSRAANPPNLPPEWQDSRPAPGGQSESETSGEWFRPRQKGRPTERQDAAGSTAARVPAGAGAPTPAPGFGSGPGAGEPRQAPAPRPTGAPASPFAAADRRGPAEDPFGAKAAPAGAGQGGAPTGRFAGDPYGPPPRRETTAEAPGRGYPQGADPFGAPRAGTRPPMRDEEPEDTQIGGFDPIRDEIAPGGIPGRPAAQRFGSAPAAADPFAAGRSGPPSADPFAAPKPGIDPFAAPQPGSDPFAAPQPGSDPFASPRPNGRFADVPYEPASPFPGSPKPAAPQGSSPVPGDVGPATGFPSTPEPAQAAGAEPASAPPAESAPAKKAPAKRRSRGRKLAVYTVGGLLFAGAAAYGTGLMMNQADIPEGTTVLGADIGGDSRDKAVSTLDNTVGKTGQQPIKLKIGGQETTLDPASAGLSFDTTATVDGLTKHSYNPLEVIGSLTGGSKAVAPAVRVDRAKLKSALDGLATSSGQGLQEGFIRFTDAGQPEVVPGKPGQVLDTAAAADQVEQAYRNRAAGQPDGEIALNLTTAQPKIGQDALQAAADGLGKQVVNGTITVVAGTRTFTFGPKTAATALTLVADGTGAFVPKWDPDKLNDALKGAFDKVKFRNKNGALVPITPQDVADGISSVFDKTGKDRKYTFPS